MTSHGASRPRPSAPQLLDTLHLPSSTPPPTEGTSIQEHADACAPIGGSPVTTGCSSVAGGIAPSRFTARSCVDFGKAGGFPSGSRPNQRPELADEWCAACTWTRSQTLVKQCGSPKSSECQDLPTQHRASNQTQHWPALHSLTSSTFTSSPAIRAASFLLKGTIRCPARSRCYMLLAMRG